MNTPELKIVLDVNILLSIISKKSPHRWIFDNIISGNIKLCISNDILHEYHEILLQKTNSEVANNLIKFISVSSSTILADIFYNFNLITNDPDDNKYVDCYISSNASIILTNDKHFNILNSIEFPPIKVLTLREFETQFKSLFQTK